MNRARRDRVVAATTLVAVACILHVSACKDDGTHVYVGRFYVERSDCLETPSALDVVSGDVPGTCEPICFVRLRAEGDRPVYVSALCPPYPPAFDFDTTGTDPRCPKALEALARGAECLSDGGSTKPAPPVIGDASAD